MSEQQAIPPEDHSQDRNIVRILQYFFCEHFVPEEKVVQQMRAYVAPGYFLGWLHAKSGLYDADFVCNTLQVPMVAWDALWALLDSGTAIERLAGVWPFITMSDRPTPEHKLESVNTIMLLTWADGSIMPISISIKAAMMGGCKVPTDAHIVSIIGRNVTRSMTDIVVQDGLDKLHAQASDFRGKTPVDPYEVFVGLFDKLMKEGFKDGPIDPAYVPYLEKYMQMIQGMLRPPIPPHIKAALDGLANGNKPVARGGWDAG